MQVWDGFVRVNLFRELSETIHRLTTFGGTSGQFWEFCASFSQHPPTLNSYSNCFYRPLLANRFMRAETNQRGSPMDHFRNLLNRPAGDSTPTTPTIYQRMHSNDSGKSSDKENRNYEWLEGLPSGGCSSNGNRYRKSSSPARHPPGSYATTGRTSRFPNARPPGNLMRNLRHSEMRRSSAAGLSGASAQRPPLPPKIETRCHSYDGLLGGGDESKKRTTPEGRDVVDAAAAPSKSQPVPLRDDPAGKSAAPPEESIKAKNRRSRSMDDLFDDDGHHATAVADFLENTQSMENLSEPPPAVPTSPPPPPDSPVPIMGGGNICLNRRFVEPAVECRSSDTASPESCYEEPCENEVITVDSTPRREDDAVSTTSSVASGTGKKTSSNNQTTSPFINKYVKKVKSLMKKWGGASSNNVILFPPNNERRWKETNILLF